MRAGASLDRRHGVTDAREIVCNGCLQHPLVGELRLRRHRFPIPDSDGQHLQIYHAAPGSDAASRLAQLAVR
ncbi:hypothetical protein C6A86_023280 [Mycobacterium sp. ITM-2016-00316]|uniref:MmyB family transcriptional regulator n=1 Tax=Mycobacterium sp. ITM-2016-00316 TaxID=2099695 RepID=UPI0013050122|nr:hypothetical protein [Mycobacterium sp. ITM-2016-00316]WNG81086.1 hypothetical protein C6A86_023280 [Mycobacterium sp. ITM-2016-00316]